MTLKVIADSVDEALNVASDQIESGVDEDGIDINLDTIYVSTLDKSEWGVYPQIEG